MRTTEKAEIFQNREITVQTEALRDISELRAYAFPIRPDVCALDGRVTACRMGQAAQHPHRRCFAGAIRAEKTKNRSRLDLKRKILHSVDAAETLAQMVEHDHRFAHVETLLR